VTRDELEALLGELRAENAAVRAENAALVERVEELERRLSQDSRNSSVSPSSDPPKSRAERRREARAKAKELAKRDGERRQPGGQPGHPGTHREMVAPERVDQRTEHLPDGCSCGHRFCGGEERVDDPVVHQKWELPPVRPLIFQYDLVRLRCPCCGKPRLAGLPEGVLERAKGGSGLTVKRMEKAVARDAERIKRLRDANKDLAVTFEHTGFDYVIVDEAHGYKNLATDSNIQDAAIEGSKRATDLHLKLELLRQRQGARVATFATATPIANSVTEAHVMQRYLRPDLLRTAGVEGFDQWAATFGQTVTEMEMAPAGAGSYRLKTRFARFQNVPEMLRMWHVFADVKTAEDLALPVPQLVKRNDGTRGPQT